MAEHIDAAAGEGASAGDRITASPERRWPLFRRLGVGSNTLAPGWRAARPPTTFWRLGRLANDR